MKLNVKHRHWDYTCGDGCCYECGIETTIEVKGREYVYEGSDTHENILKFFKGELKYEIVEEDVFDYQDTEDYDD